jgi:NAD(P)-dependent dehydrogenase (short-subunit alcohol dehydrogenase family)
MGSSRRPCEHEGDVGKRDRDRRGPRDRRGGRAQALARGTRSRPDRAVARDNVVGAITAVAHLAPRMAEAGNGTILLTGGMPDPIPEATSLSLGKAGVRALAGLLAKAYGPSRIHVATVTVAGGVSPGSAFDPDEIAECYWQIHLQPPGEWEREVLFSGSQ